MNMILEADETGALWLPPLMLPHPGPHRRYRVTATGGQVVVDEVPSEAGKDEADHQAWLEELARRRARGATGKTGTPTQQMWDELREDRC